MQNFIKLLLICMLALCTLSTTLAFINYGAVDAELRELRRVRRQFDLTLSADHDDKDDDTEIALEAIANLWRSDDLKTELDGSIKVIHRSNSLQSGNTRFSGRLHLHHDYKRK